MSSVYILIVLHKSHLFLYIVGYRIIIIIIIINFITAHRSK